MSITVELWEDSGPLVGGVPSSRELIANVNWKNAVGQAPDYFSYPIRQTVGGLNYSYPKFIYAKIYGTYATVKRLRWRLKYLPSTDNSVIMLWGQTNVYTQPAHTWTSGSPWVANGDRSCMLSLTGPQGANILPTTLTPNTTYYTDYLVTQLLVRAPGDTSLPLPLGNTIPMEISITMDEY